jgi:hypothetical protein
MHFVGQTDNFLSKPTNHLSGKKTQRKLNEETWMKIQPTLHWNNFTVPELKEILEHCTALERLGIAQDEEMMCSIQRDIDLREEKTAPMRPQPRAVKIKKPAVARRQPEELLLEQTA